MTGPVPPHWVTADDGVWLTVEVQLPELRTAQTTISKRAFGTPEGDAALRSIVERHESTRDTLRGGF